MIRFNGWMIRGEDGAASDVAGADEPRNGRTAISLGNANAWLYLEKGEGPDGLVRGGDGAYASALPQFAGAGGVAIAVAEGFGGGIVAGEGILVRGGDGGNSLADGTPGDGGEPTNAASDKRSGDGEFKKGLPGEPGAGTSDDPITILDPSELAVIAERHPDGKAVRWYVTNDVPETVEVPAAITNLHVKLQGFTLTGSAGERDGHEVGDEDGRGDDGHNAIVFNAEGGLLVIEGPGRVVGGAGRDGAPFGNGVAPYSLATGATLVTAPSAGDPDEPVLTNGVDGVLFKYVITFEYQGPLK